MMLNWYANAISGLFQLDLSVYPFMALGAGALIHIVLKMICGGRF